MSLDVATGRGKRELLLVVRRFANEELEPLDAFKPPVAEEFRIERAYHDGIDIHGTAQLTNLVRPLGHEMCGMRFSGSLRPFATVNFLLTPPPPSDSVVLETSELPMAVLSEKGSKIF